MNETMKDQEELWGFEGRWFSDEKGIERSS